MRTFTYSLSLSPSSPSLSPALAPASPMSTSGFCRGLHGWQPPLGTAPTLRRRLISCLCGDTKASPPRPLSLCTDLLSTSSPGFLRWTRTRGTSAHARCRTVAAVAAPSHVLSPEVRISLLSPPSQEPSQGPSQESSRLPSCVPSLTSKHQHSRYHTHHCPQPHRYQSSS